MGQDTFEIVVNCIKLVVVFLMMVQLVPILVWLERRGSAFIQNRLGPNRVGPLGLTQLLADAAKFLLNSIFMPLLLSIINSDFISASFSSSQSFTFIAINLFFTLFLSFSTKILSHL